MSKSRLTSINFYHDWDSFIFWGKSEINWRNFTLIELTVETNPYSVYLEIHFAILGVHVDFDWWRKHE